jgi:tRNA (mo5U34)-methyltransferase
MISVMSEPGIDDAIRANPLWYHTIDVGPGAETPGWFDLRPIVDVLPWPDVRGKRCLDVGTYDGYLAFELERRGAAEVVATDISDHGLWDWPARIRAVGPEALAAMAGPEKGVGFEIARRLRGSAVEKRAVNVYDLSPETVGTFDVVVCGSLMLHLRDPIRALEAIRSVCTGVFLSAEQVDLVRSLPVLRRAPLARLDGVTELCQWWVPNITGHRRMLLAAGFDILRTSPMYAIRYGVAHPPRPSDRKARGREALERRLAGSPGIVHAAALARPAL